MLHVFAAYPSACPCWRLVLSVHVSMLQVHAAWTCCASTNINIQIIFHSANKKSGFLLFHQKFCIFLLTLLQNYVIFVENFARFSQIRESKYCEIRGRFSLNFTLRHPRYELEPYVCNKIIRDGYYYSFMLIFQLNFNFNLALLSL
jgi:hypothetical protein